RGDEVNVRAVDGDSGVSDSRIDLKTSAEHRRQDAVVRGWDRISHARFQLGQVKEVSPVEWQILNLLAADHTTHLVLLVVNEGGGVIDRDLFAYVANLE